MLLLNTKDKTGNKQALIIDANDIYRVKKITANCTSNNITNKSGSKTSMTPAEVATPLPPLNLSQTG